MATECPRIEIQSNTGTFGLGWFWGPERQFRRLPGVLDAVCCYVGGDKINPTYHSIGDHTEGIHVTYDPAQISYEQLVDFFFSKCSLTSSCSASKQYLTGVWYHNDEQQHIVAAKISDIEERQNCKVLIHRSALTESGVYKAEEYHQKFFEKNPESAW